MINLQNTLNQMMLIQLSNIYQKKVALEKATNKLYFVEIAGEEVIATPLDKENGQTEFGKKENFLFAEIQENQPLQNHYQTITKPLPNVAETVIKPLPTKQILIKGSDTHIIVFNSKRKENIISNSIKDNDLQKQARLFESLVIKKLELGISKNAIISTHSAYQKYIKLINSNEKNKIIKLNDMIFNLNSSIAKAKSEKIRSISRINENEKEIIKNKSKKEFSEKLKSRLVSFIIITMIFISLYLYFNPIDFSVELINSTEEPETKEGYWRPVESPTPSKNKQPKIIRKQYTNAEIEILIDAYSTKHNIKIWKYRRNLIKKALKKKKLTKWEANNIIKKNEK